MPLPTELQDLLTRYSQVKEMPIADPNSCTIQDALGQDASWSLAGIIGTYFSNSQLISLDQLGILNLISSISSLAYIKGFLDGGGYNA